MHLLTAAVPLCVLAAASGTPLQTDLGELQTLLSFLLPQLFKADSVLGGEGAEEHLVERIKTVLAPFILRCVPACTCLVCLSVHVCASVCVSVSVRVCACVTVCVITHLLQSPYHAPPPHRRLKSLITPPPPTGA